MLTDPEVATVKDAFIRTRDKALFILGLKTGLRISELSSLKVGDVYQYGRLGDVVYVERKYMKKSWRVGLSLCTKTPKSL
jgi:integrase